MSFNSIEKPKRRIVGSTIEEIKRIPEYLKLAKEFGVLFYEGHKLKRKDPESCRVFEEVTGQIGTKVSRDPNIVELKKAWFNTDASDRFANEQAMHGYLSAYFSKTINEIDENEEIKKQFAGKKDLLDQLKLMMLHRGYPAMARVSKIFSDYMKK